MNNKAKTISILTLLIISSIIIGDYKKRNISDTTAATKLNKQEILDLVNKARSKGCNCGDVYYPPVSPVVWNDKLKRAAQIHSDDMHNNAIAYHEEKIANGHKVSDSSSPIDRAYRAGYYSNFFGENIHIETGKTNEARVIQSWLNSKGHCKTIMKANFSEMVVAASGWY